MREESEFASALETLWHKLSAAERRSVEERVRTYQRDEGLGQYKLRDLPER
jgi:hypothetical protein